MKRAYCLPIQKTHKTEILGIINGNLDKYPYFEVWLDYVEQADEAFIRQLIELLGDRLVVTSRRQNLETPLMDPARRQTLLGLFRGSPCLVDLDITTQQTELDGIKNDGLNIRTITSYHNYQETPDTLQLEEIIDTMRTYQPAVYKLSTLCKNNRDAVRLLRQLLDLKAEGLSAIVLGMGPHGAATRTFGLLWGNEMVFAPLAKEDSSDPGQLTRQQLETILNELEK